MSNSATAEIIPFPARGAPADTPSDAQQRLTRALAALNAAMQEQRAAVAGWRDSLDQLKKSTTGLGLSMQRYRGTLDRLGADVASLHDEAKRMEGWADRALAAAEQQETVLGEAAPMPAAQITVPRQAAATAEAE